MEKNVEIRKIGQEEKKEMEEGREERKRMKMCREREGGRERKRQRVRERGGGAGRKIGQVAIKLVRPIVRRLGNSLGLRWHRPSLPT